MIVKAKTMRTLLINPYTNTSVYGKISKDMPVKHLPLGLLYIAAVLLKHKKQVQLVDADAMSMELEALSEVVKDYSPDIVGITSSTQGFQYALKTAWMIKDLSNAVVVIGGPHASPLADQILKEYKPFDVVVRGEGEFSMLGLCREVPLDQISGISYRRDGRVIHNNPRARITNLDALPLPAYDLVDLSLYDHPAYKIYIKRIAPIISGRGCPYECTFCASKVIFGTRVIYRSVNNVIEQIKCLISEKGITGINFVDDTFSLNKTRLLGFCEELKKLKIRWICNIRVDTVDLELLKRMQDSGCCLIQIGVESADQYVLNLMKKRVSVKQIRKVFEWANKIKLDTLATFIIGMPGDTEETINKTIRFVCEINPTYPQFFNLVPYPGTEIYDYAKENNLLLFNDWTQLYAPKYEQPAMGHHCFSAEQLKLLRKKAYRKAYLNPRYVVSHFFPTLRDVSKRSYILSHLRKFIKDFII